MRNRLRAANLRSRRVIPREVHKEEHVEEHLVFEMGNRDRDWKSIREEPAYTNSTISFTETHLN